MANLRSVGYDAQHGVNSVRRSETLEKLTRVGIACKGIVYLLIGVLALMAAFQQGGGTTDQRGALQRIAGQPFGEFLLIVMAVGLLAYAAWRFLSATLNTEGESRDGKGFAKRAGYFISGLIYSSVAIYAFNLATGNGGGGGNQAQTWTAKLLDAPGGVLLVALAGVAIVVAGVMQIKHGMKEEFLQKLRLREMSASERDVAVRAGKWGYSARGVTFGVMGTLLVLAAIRHNPGEAKGLEGALDTLASQPFGQFILALVAAGLAGYGVYCMFEARYRTVRH